MDKESGDSRKVPYSQTPEYKREYYKKNKERILARQHEYQRKNQDKIKSTKRKWYLAMTPARKKEYIAYQMEWYRKHFDDVSARRKERYRKQKEVK